MGCTKTLKKKPTEYLRRLYYGSMVFIPERLRPPDRGGRREPDRSGHGLSVSLTKTAVDHILTTPGSSDAERAA
jgi:aminocarboxymuconate-semialdehyde decarboxylase